MQLHIHIILHISTTTILVYSTNKEHIYISIMDSLTLIGVTYVYTPELRSIEEDVYQLAKGPIAWSNKCEPTYCFPIYLQPK